MKHYVYKVEWKTKKGDDRFYIGESNDPLRRLGEHQSSFKNKKMKVKVLYTFTGKNSIRKAKEKELSLIYKNFMKYGFNQSEKDSPFMNRYTLSLRGWLKRKMPDVYDVCF